jgi:hypothetical protein
LAPATVAFDDLSQRADIALPPVFSTIVPLCGSG